MSTFDARKHRQTLVAERDEPLRLLASALFMDPISVDALGRYLVGNLCDTRIKTRGWLDDMCRAILFAPLSMRLVGIRDLPTGHSNRITTVATLELFEGHNLVVPMNLAAECNLESLYRAVTMFATSMSKGGGVGGFYNHVRFSQDSTEIILEHFNAKQQAARYAWPVLLATVCYRHATKMLMMLVEQRGMDEAFAADLMRLGHTSLTELLAGRTTFDEADDDVLGRMVHLTLVPREALFQQLATLEAILNKTELGVVYTHLNEFASLLAAQCVPEQEVGVTQR